MPAGEPPRGEAAPRRSPYRVPFWARLAFGLLVLVGVAYAVLDAGREARTATWPGAVQVAVSAALVTVMLAAGAAAWDVLMRTHARRLDLLRAFTVAQLSKYVPGGVAQVVGQVGQATGAGASALAAVTGMTTQALVGVLAPGLLAVSLLMLVDVDLPVLVRVVLGAACLLGAGLLAWRSFLAALVASRPAQRLPGVRHLRVPDQATLAKTFGWGFVALMALGSAFATLVGPDGLGPRQVLVLVLAYATSFVVGFVAIPVPAGLGVREGVLVALLASTIPATEALATCVVLRVVQLAVELVLAGPVMLAGRTAPGGAPSGNGANQP